MIEDQPPCEIPIENDEFSAHERTQASFARLEVYLASLLMKSDDHKNQAIMIPGPETTRESLKHRRPAILLCSRCRTQTWR